MTTNYQVALADHGIAYKLYAKAIRAYRAREIGDSDFGSACQIFKSATALFDAAFAAEADLEPEKIESESSETQILLF